MNMLSFYMLLGMEQKVSCILGRHSITKLPRTISPEIHLLLYAPQVLTGHLPPQILSVLGELISPAILPHCHFAHRL